MICFFVFCWRILIKFHCSFLLLSRQTFKMRINLKFCVLFVLLSKCFRIIFASEYQMFHTFSFVSALFMALGERKKKSELLRKIHHSPENRLSEIVWNCGCNVPYDVSGKMANQNVVDLPNSTKCGLRSQMALFFFRLVWNNAPQDIFSHTFVWIENAPPKQWHA